MQQVAQWLIVCGTALCPGPHLERMRKVNSHCCSVQSGNLLVGATQLSMAARKKRVATELTALKIVVGLARERVCLGTRFTRGLALTRSDCSGEVKDLMY